ncbi:hypothetical protein [Pseudomonas sp. TE3786]
MRILIADADQYRRFTVEKLLNQAGCFGVAIAATVDELMLLIGFPGKSFDLVLVNCELLDQHSPAALEQLQGLGNVVLYRKGFISGRMADPLAEVSEGLRGLPNVAVTLH